MAKLRPNSLLAALLCCIAAGSGLHAAEKVSQPEGPIQINADTTDVDFKSGKTLLHNVSISQGDVSVRADRAEAAGIDSKDSRWEFIGNVKIIAEQRGNLQSDRAVVEIRNNQILRATVDGAPAQFEQKPTGAGTAKPARGRARQIVYEVDSGTVRFANDAWLSNGDTELSGPVLLYNIRQRKVQASSAPGGGANQRVQITIQPKDVPKKDASKIVVQPQPAPADEPKP